MVDRSLIERELSKLEEVFSKVEIAVPKYGSLYNSVKDLLEYAKCYYLDARYFYSCGKIEEAFELVSYVWGILDSLARLGFIIVPKDIKHYFKIDQEDEV